MEEKLLSQKSQRRIKYIPESNTPLKSNDRNINYNNSNIKLDKSQM